MIVLETHHYDGGLQVNTFPAERRVPLGVPAEAAVLTVDAPTEPHQTVYKVQSLIGAEGKSILWVGCYVKSIDRQLGDRENYVAVGVWLTDAVLLGCAELINLMVEGARRLHKEGMSDSLRAAFAELAKIAEQFVYPRDCFPPMCLGITGVKKAAADDRLLQLNGNTSDVPGTFDCVLINLQLSPEPFVSGRALFFFAGEGVDKHREFAPTPGRDELLMPLITSLPSMVQETTRQLIDTRQQFGEVRKQRDRLEAELKSAVSELTNLQKEYGAVLEEVRSLRKEIAALRKLPYTIIDELSKNIKSQLERIESKISVSSTVEKPRKVQKSAEKTDDIDPMMSVLKWIGIIMVLLAVGVGGSWLVFQALSRWL